MNFTQITGDSSRNYSITTPDKHVFFLHNYSGTLDIDIQVSGAEVFIFGLYIGRSAQSFDIKTIQRHSVGKSMSNLLIKGVFFNDSKFAYEGLIRIESHAQQSNAYQKNQNLIMSDTAYVDSKPYLEIQADDVRCTHGSTTGRLSQDQLLYLADRGLDPKQAQDLLIEGFIDDLFTAMKSTDSSLPDRSILSL